MFTTLCIGQAYKTIFFAASEQS